MIEFFDRVPKTPGTMLQAIKYQNKYCDFQIYELEVCLYFFKLNSRHIYSFLFLINSLVDGLVGLLATVSHS